MHFICIFGQVGGIHILQDNSNTEIIEAILPLGNNFGCSQTRTTEITNPTLLTLNEFYVLNFR